MKIYDKNGIPLKEGDLVMKPLIYRGQINGHKYRKVKKVITPSKEGYNINNYTWIKYEDSKDKSLRKH